MYCILTNTDTFRVLSVTRVTPAYITCTIYYTLGVVSTISYSHLTRILSYKYSSSSRCVMMCYTSTRELGLRLAEVSLIKSYLDTAVHHRLWSRLYTDIYNCHGYLYTQHTGDICALHYDIHPHLHSIEYSVWYNTQTGADNPRTRYTYLYSCGMSHWILHHSYIYNFLLSSHTEH